VVEVGNLKRAASSNAWSQYYPSGGESAWTQAALLEERDLGVLLALVTLLLGVVSRSYQAQPTTVLTSLSLSF
jgi:hypothetical protein